MLVTLKTLRASLTKKYKVEFPLFDRGCIYLTQKSGEYVSAGEFWDDLSDTSLVLKAGKSFVGFLDAVLAENKEKECAEGETAIVIGEIYRHNGEWKFNTVGAGVRADLPLSAKISASKLIRKNFGGALWI